MPDPVPAQADAPVATTPAADSAKALPRSRAGRFFRALIMDLARAASVLVLLHLFVFQFSVVRGTSMRPNIEDGDRLLVDRVSYAVAEIDRFDVVILKSPHDDKVDYVKRIIGLPGDRIEIQEGRIYVNGRRMAEPFESYLDRAGSRSYVVPEKSYFVLGDNRPVSSDSREGWYVAYDRIKGRVRACVWPPNHLRSF